MNIRLRCPDEHCHRYFPLTGKPVAGAKAACPACATEQTLSVPADWNKDGRVHRCPACSGNEFFLRRDFPQRFGMGIVVAAGMASTVIAVFFSDYMLWAYGLLAAVVLLDAVIYMFVGTLSVCYRCRAEFRGFTYNADHSAYDLATDEKYSGA